MVGGELAHLSHVVCTFLFSDTGETHSGLTTTTVFLGKLYEHALQYVLCVTLDSGIQNTITVDNNKAELLIIVHKGKERGNFKSCLAAVGECSEWLEGLNVERDLLFTLAVASLNDTAKESETIWWDVFVKP